MEDRSLGFTHRYLPGAADGAPTIVLLHGTGGDENDLLALGRMLAPDAPLLSPRGKVLEQGMPRFFRRLAVGVFDQEDLVARTHELADFVAAAAAHYGFDPQAVVAVGYSNGANIAASTLLLRPEIFRAAVLFHAVVPFEPDTAPDLSGRRIFLSGGQRDPYAPVARTERLAEILRLGGAEVTVHWQPGGHELTTGEVDASKAWLSRLPMQTRPTRPTSAETPGPP